MTDTIHEQTTRDGKPVKHEIPGTVEVGQVLSLRVGPYKSQPHRVIEILEVFDAEDRPDELWREVGTHTHFLAEVIEGSPVRDCTPPPSNDGDYA